MVRTTLDNAREMAKRAIAARELVYRGLDEAKARFRSNKDRSNYAGLSIEDEKQKFLTSAQARTWISDNRWHIDQSIMYSSLSVAEDTHALLVEARKTNLLLETLLRRQTEYEAAGRS